MKAVLLDRRLGSHGGHDPQRWLIRQSAEIKHKGGKGHENTFAFIDAFGEVMTGSLETVTDYTPIKDYDLIYVRMRQYTGLNGLKKLRNTCKNSIIVLYIDEWVNFINFTPNTWISKASKYVDAVTSGFGAEYEKEAFRNMGVKNYYHLPYAGPTNYWKTWFRPREEKEFAVVGMWHIRSCMQQGRGDRIHSQTLRTLRYLQNKHGIECWFFLNFDGWKAEEEIKKYIGNSDIKLLRHMPNFAFNEKMASALLFIEEYPCPCFSRGTVVSAAVGTPQVGNDMNEPSTRCFPDLTVKFGNWEEWTNLADRLITDEKFWTEQRDQGFKNVDYYNSHGFKERMLELYKKLGGTI